MTTAPPRLGGLGTGAWYAEEGWDLPLPEEWRVTIHWPRTPDPLSDEEIAAAVGEPVAHSTLRDAARGARRPLVLVDDLTRPTPADRIMPFLLNEFRAASIDPSDITILMGTGTHSSAGLSAARRKVGAEAAELCRLAVHDDRGALEPAGKTRFGTTIKVNPLVVESDFVCGIGGVYPQHAVGFGGGSKLILGALGRSTIAALHYRHKSMEGRYDVDNDFRRELDEIAAKVGLDYLFTAHVDARRNLVRLVCGDWRVFYPREVDFARHAYAAPPPGDAAVVISNSYPIDVSLTFMRSKGIIPLLHAAPGASRILLSGCAEGVGRHGLYPLRRTSMERAQHLLRASWLRRGDVPAKIRRRLAAKLQRGARAAAPARLPMRLFVSEKEALPDEVEGLGFALYRSWTRLVEDVRAEQGRDDLDVVVYPCAPLQVLDERLG